MTQLMAWQRFVLEHGFKARGYELAAVLERDLEDVDAFRRIHYCKRLRRLKRFAELFTLWRGRPPRDNEWPVPRRQGRGQYDWQAPEDALLASLIGRIGPREVVKVLSKRIKMITGDRRATRSYASVLTRLQKIGMQTKDIVGGITASDAGREIGSYTPVWQAIRAKRLQALKVGTLLVIPHAAWAAFKAKRVFAPAGYVQLSKLKRPLGIRSDKLSEWARMGYVPTAVRCNPCGTKVRSTKFGTWFISPQMARKLIADRRAGRPMPWWGMPEPSNLTITYRLWRKRQHPAACKTCKEIWGKDGAPSTFEDYCKRYHPLAHGAKRHLTMVWSWGMTVAQVARYVSRSVSYVALAIENGNLEVSHTIGRTRYIARTEATRWKHRRFPNGASDRSWVSLHEARRLYLFKLNELRAFIRSRVLRSKVGTNGPMRGITYVPRHQCGMLRERIGFTVSEAARRAKISVARFKTLVLGVDWRHTEKIPLVTVQAVIKRLYVQDGGCTIGQAAYRLGVAPGWIHDRILDGTIRIMRSKFDKRRLYISAPMFERLKEAKRHPPKRERFGKDWLHVSDAALEAGVSIGTIDKWSRVSELKRRRSITGYRYHIKAVRARARIYWKKPRFRRGVPPEWLRIERERKNDEQSKTTTGLDRATPRRRPPERLAGGIHREREAGAQPGVSPRHTNGARRRASAEPAGRDRRGLVAAARAGRARGADPLLHRLRV